MIKVVVIKKILLRIPVKNEVEKGKIDKIVSPLKPKKIGFENLSY
jgi:hypothetical protein